MPAAKRLLPRTMAPERMKWGLGATIIFIAAAPAAFGQARPATEQDLAQSGFSILEEIVVTARRRAETLQDVPVSVSAFSADRVAELQADTLAGLQYAAPNLYLDKGDASNAVIYIRGIGQNDSLAFADSGVGVYVDDVFIARSQAAFLDLFDVERVEVLRGPQGTLYGRNTVGGAVKFVSTLPGEDFEAYGEVGAGDFGFATVKGRVSGPLVGDKLRAKAALAATRRKGYASNTVTGEDDGDLKSLAWRLAFLYAPSEKLDILFSYDGKLDRPDTSRSPVRETAILGFADPINAPFSPASFAPNEDNYQVDVNANGLSDLTAHGLSLKLNWAASDAWSVEAITAYRRMDFDLNLDTDGSPLPILDILLLQDQKQFSQEVRATYAPDADVTMTGGVYYFYDDDLTFSGVDNLSAALFGFPVTLFGLPTSSLADTAQKTNSIAAFIDASFALSERLSVSAGVRYTYERKTSGRRFELFFDPAISVITDTPPFLAGVGVPGTTLAGKKNFDALTPKFSLSYKVSDDIMVYASASRGFKSGGFDGRGNSDFTFQPFDPETMWSYEGGVKSRWHDGRLVVNAAYFYNDYKDLQVTSFGSDPVSGTFVSLFTNAAAARIQGLELDIAARPSTELTLSATLGYLDADYQAFETLVGGVVTDVSDRSLVNAPKWNASLGATYERPMTSSLIGVVHGDAAYRGKTYNEITASERLAQDSYVIVNAFVSLKTLDARWELRGGVKNLTNREIRVQGFNLSEFPGVELSFFSAPRTFDVRLFYRY
ncbi:MAG: TonB-dependent receptor [Pseudomonadota bacterium]